MASINLSDFATGDGVTDDFAAITAAITAARTAKKTLVMRDPDAVYAHSGTINWAWNQFRAIADEGNVRFKHTGSGVAHSFNGMTNYPGSQGCSGGVFGGPNRVFADGNANTTDLFLVDNWHFGEMKIAGQDCTGAVLRGQDTGLPQVGSCSVRSVYDVHASRNSSGGMQTVTPLHGIRMVKPAACTFDNPLIEFVGNVPAYTPGISLAFAHGCIFNGGTVESCINGGIADGSGERNVYISVHNEANGNASDWIVTASNGTYIGCAGGGGRATADYLGGNNNRYKGCKFNNITIPVGATNNRFEGCKITGTITDHGTGTVITP